MKTNYALGKPIKYGAVHRACAVVAQHKSQLQTCLCVVDRIAVAPIGKNELIEVSKR